MLLNQSKNNGKSTEHSFLKEFMQIRHIIKFHNMRGKNEITVECCLAEYAFSYIHSTAFFFIYPFTPTRYCWPYLCSGKVGFGTPCTYMNITLNMMLMVFIFFVASRISLYIININEPGSETMDKRWRQPT
jgi:hypothetical protein